MLALISILLAWLIGFLLIQVFDPVRDMHPRWAAVGFDAALGAGIGIGLTSTIFLLLDVSGIATPAAIFGIDIILVAVLAWRWLRVRSGDLLRSTSDAATPGFRWTWLLVAAFGTVLVITWMRVVQIAIALPVGDWDAWATWNLRAKFLAGPGGAWRYALSPLLNNTHPDYPLLLSAFVARSWKASGTVDTFAPVVTALLFFAALLALLLSVVALLRGAASALLAGLVMLSTTSLLVWVPAQYSDIPLAFYFLAATALLFLEPSETARGQCALFWAGLCAGLAACTKNEGVVFLGCLIFVFFAFTLWKRQTGTGETRTAPSRTIWLLAGAAPGVLLTLWLKFFLAPAADPLVTQGVSGLARLRDLSRYVEVAKGFFDILLNLGSGLAHPLILLAILAIALRWQVEERNKLPALIAIATLTLVFLSYCLVFLITPTGLILMLQTTFDRLLLQVWPSFLLIFFILLRRVADPASAAAARSPVRKSPVRLARLAPTGKKVK
jgi:hypothetical protein